MAAQRLGSIRTPDGNAITFTADVLGNGTVNSVTFTNGSIYIGTFLVTYNDGTPNESFSAPPGTSTWTPANPSVWGASGNIATIQIGYRLA